MHFQQVLDTNSRILESRIKQFVRREIEKDKKLEEFEIEK